MPRPLPQKIRRIPWRVDSTFAQQVEDAINMINRPLPPRERLSLNMVIHAAMEEYLPKLEALAAAVQKEEK